MEFLLAVAAAVSYGVSDFTGGVLTRRAHVFVVSPLSQLVSFALLVVAVTLWAHAISWPAVGWGTAAGLAGWMGTSLLYQGLAIGRMSVVAPITAHGELIGRRIPAWWRPTSLLVNHARGGGTMRLVAAATVACGKYSRIRPRSRKPTAAYRCSAICVDWRLAV